MGGTQKNPGLTATVNGNVVANTKTVSNNVRFHNCTFEGTVVTDAPPNDTHACNKAAFTGTIEFDIEGSANLTDRKKVLYKRSTIVDQKE